MTEDKMVRWLTNSMDMGLSKLWEMVKNREAWHVAVHGSYDCKKNNNNNNSLKHLIYVSCLLLNLNLRVFFFPNF